MALRARIDQIYAKHTGQAIERVHPGMERDRLFSSEDAIGYGLADRVLEQRELARGTRGSGQG